MGKAFSIKLKNEIAYVYMWVSIQHKYVYVGETARLRYGVLGRAIEHIHYSNNKDNWGTLRKNVFKHREIQLEDVDDFYLLSFPLQKQRGYPDYKCSEMDRETVEYLVRNMWNVESVKRFKKAFLCESKADYHEFEYKNKYNHMVAEEIVKEALEEIATIIID